MNSPKLLLSSEEQRQCIFNILLYLDGVCRENSIHYSLTGGTLLGAVRHKGFIPWDDDIDVFLTRPEFEKLNRLLHQQKKYTWLTTDSDNWHAGYCRIVDPTTEVFDDELGELKGLGLFIDVCIVDGLPNNPIIRLLFMSRLRLLYRLRRSTYEQKRADTPHNPVKRIIKRVVRRITLLKGPEHWTRKINRICSKYPVEKSTYVANLLSQYGKKELLHKSGFDRYHEMTFEGHSFMVFDGWEEYLTNIYGDYMTLPPEEKRHGHHFDKAYRKG